MPSRQMSQFLLDNILNLILLQYLLDKIHIIIFRMLLSETKILAPEFNFFLFFLVLRSVWRLFFVSFSSVDVQFL